MAPSPSTAADAPVLEARGLAKSYGQVVALECGDLTVAGGEIHALLGSNGSGKSTLCKILAGAVKADAGELLQRGRRITLQSPPDARAAGIGTVYQETSLIPALTVAQNIQLGIEARSRLRLVDSGRSRREAVRRIEDFGSTLGIRFGPDDIVGDLAIDQQQLVEIIRVVSRRPSLVIFDEATASLDRVQVDGAFALLRRLREEGKSAILVTHRMDEIFSIADRVTVMRNGRSVGTREVRDVDPAALIDLMTGAPADAPPVSRRAQGSEQPILTVRDLSSDAFRDVSFALRRGEVLGLGGLQGQGQSELLRTIFGALKPKSGEIEMAGIPGAPATPAAAVRRGLAFASGDRKRYGTFAIRSIFENLAIARLAQSRSPLVSRARLEPRLMQSISGAKLKFGRLDDSISTLSGGNQQKVVIGRWLDTDPKVLLLDDPTKGIDIRAKRDLYEMFSVLQEKGLAIVIYSSDATELLEIADRILVINGGHVVDELKDDRKTEFELNAAALKGA